MSKERGSPTWERIRGEILFREVMAPPPPPPERCAGRHHIDRIFGCGDNQLVITDGSNKE